MTSVEQFLFVLLPLVVLAGGIAAAVLHRLGMRDRRGRRGPGPRPAGPHPSGAGSVPGA